MEKREPNYKVQGYLGDKLQKERQVMLRAKNLIRVFEGYHLDKIEIQATITSERELIDFIIFLRQSQSCFYSHQKKLPKF